MEIDYLLIRLKKSDYLKIIECDLSIEDEISQAIEK